MTEKEKMLSGKLYFPLVKELEDERCLAKDLIHEYNNISPKEIDKREAILKKLLGKTERIFKIESPFTCDYGYNILVGENFYANTNLTILDCGKVSIGDNVFIGPNTSIYTVNHPTNRELRIKAYQYASPITIGNDVWIGGNVVINPGVNIGNNTIIGAGSVVTKDIPSDVIAAGNPCRIIRSIDESKE